jgi:hypothetical protein
MAHIGATSEVIFLFLMPAALATRRIGGHHRQVQDRHLR